MISLPLIGMVDMFANLQAKLIAFLVSVIAIIAAVAAAFLKGKQAATAEIKTESTEKLMEDLADKREIRDEVTKDIAHSDRDERINSL